MPSPAAVAPSTGVPDEYRAGSELAAWKNGLLTGRSEYRVPATMTAQHVSTVTVVIHGFADTKAAAMPDATGGGELKVSSKMKVELLAPLNPSEFDIKPQANPAIQFIPNDGYQTWVWDVTPHLGAKAQRLQIRVSLVHPGPDGVVEQVIDDKTYDVDVEIKSSARLIEEEYQQNRIAWWQTIWAKLAALVTSLGGVSGIVAWWQKRKKQPG